MQASFRLSTIARQMRGYATSARVTELTTPKPDDIVVTYAKRSAMCRAFKGSFRDTSPDTLLYQTLQKGVKEAGLKPGQVEDIIVGNCHLPSPAYHARAAALAAGFPEHVPVEAINRLCASGLQAIRHVADSIRAGDIEIGIAAGVESMTHNPRPNPVFEEKAIDECQPAIDCAEPMGWTSENVAADFKISREDMDKWGLASHNRASEASKSGRFLEEIIPIDTTIHADAKDKSSPVSNITVTEDDGIRHGMTMEKMAAAKPAFSWGNKQSTGPNTSQMTDGAAMAVLMKRSTAEALGQPILATYITSATVGVTPKYMGIGPVPAITKALKNAGLSKDDVDVFEINEAFSSMMVYTTRELGLDPAKVNPNGGAIALGHPLGATGIRQVVTGLHEVIRRNQQEKGPKILVTSMCVGSGMGAAAVFAV